VTGGMRCGVKGFTGRGKPQRRRKSDPHKVRIAGRLRRETTMTLKWIADRLCMGTATHGASLLQRHCKKGPSSEESLFCPHTYRSGWQQEVS
jgi:hypothetical protein